MKYQGIYKIRNLLNGKVYIGQSSDINIRFKDHKKKCKSKINRPLYSAINKHGLINFEFNIIEHIDDISKLDEREQYWMDFYKSYNPEFGYNLSPTSGGSTRGIKLKEEHKRRISLSGLGRKHSKESILKMSLSQKGKTKSKEHRLKLSKIAKKRWENSKYRKHMSEVHKGHTTWNKGLQMSEQFCTNLSKAKKGKKLPPFTEEHKLKIGLAHKGKIVLKETRQKIAEARKGTKQSGENRKRISESMKLKWQDPNYKKNKKLQESKLLILSKIEELTEDNLIKHEAMNV